MPNTPDTLNDMILGYAIGMAILFVTVASIWWRYRNLAADEQTLENLNTDIQKESQPSPEAKAAASD